MIPNPHPDLTTYKFRKYLYPRANLIGAKSTAECLMCRTELGLHHITEIGSFMLCNEHWTDYWFLHKYSEPRKEPDADFNENLGDA